MSEKLLLHPSDQPVFRLLMDVRACLCEVRLSDVLHELAASGHAIVVATHDVEFVASTADRVVVLAEGEIVADGATADVVVASPVFAPQVAKITIPDRWLTVAQVAHALDQTAST